MANKQIIDSFLNPVKYHAENPTNLPQYLSKSIEKYPFVETIEEWEEEIEYSQLWQTSDKITQQFVSELGPINMKIIDESGAVYYSQNFTQKLQNKQNSAQWIYELETPLSPLNLAKGYYWFKLTIGTTSPTILISEPQFICDEIPYSVYLEYKHRSSYCNVYFGTGITFSLRILGKIKYLAPGSHDIIFFDQPNNPTLINSYVFDEWRFLVGGSWGIPDYQIRRMAWLFGCDYKTIDGTQYEKATEGAQWEANEVENYPMRGWTIKVRESLNRGAQIYENGAYQEKRTSIIMAVDTDGFGSGSGGIIPITDFN